MKRIVLWSMSTLTVLILLFGYHTSTSSRMTTTADSAAIAPISGGSPATTAGSAATAGAGSSGSTGSTGGGITTPSAPGSAPSTAAPTTAAGSTSAGSTPAAPAASTVTGSVAQTRWGPVQVQITVEAGRITDVSVVQYPHENGKDQQINARALPILIDETISAQSASIDMVSGATITSEGYVQSLQSALDQAGR
ncbi:FMN-binding protein [Nakamurella sp.]|uniref:FMN-binding protein n=1 Tax=Nakamurella sp. TaxID=1869182 RepID=UPI003B3A0579